MAGLKRGDDARGFLRGLAALVLVPLLVSAILAIGAIPAAAAPDGPGAPPGAARARAQALLDRLGELTAQGETVAEDFNAATEELRRLQAKVDLLRREIAATTERLAAAQKVLNHRARATYKNGGGDELLGMLILPELEPSTRRVLTDVLESDALAVEEATAARARIAAAERDLTAAVERQQTIMAEFERRRAELSGLTSRIIAEMRQGDAMLLTALAELRRESEARAQAYWAAFGGDGDLSPAAQAMTAVRVALEQVGDPYVYAATGPDAFDCSGLTVFSYRAAGIALPRVSRDQYRLGSKVPLTTLVPGDLVFWAHNTADPATIHHVAMYVGNGRVVHAPHPGDVVRVATIWQKGLIGAVRPVRGSSGGSPAPPIVLPPNPPDWPSAPPTQPPPIPQPPKPTPTPTSPAPSPTPAPAPSSPSPSPTPSPTPTPADTPTVTATDSGTPEPTGSDTPSASPSATASP